MNIDLKAIYAGQVSVAEVAQTVRYADLCTLTDELFTTLESILAEATDAAVLFVPRDPEASDQSEQGWTVSHVIAHLTATWEEAAAFAAMLARGVQVEGRLRYETPWEELSTAQMVRARLQESRRICRAFLNAWPDEPHLDVTRAFVSRLGEMNALGLHMLGIVHAHSHIDQLHDILHQARIAESR